MPNKMLIDASHPEETRVVVRRGSRVEEFDFESANRKQLRGNIYLAKVTRVEPSLQAAFVDYGGNRHWFLAFSEIHPDYYQIPVADRQALIAEEERAQRAAEAEADRRAGRRAARYRSRDEISGAPVESGGEAAATPDEEMAPPVDTTEELAAEAGSPVAIATEPIALEPAADASAADAEATIELAQLESNSASEPVPAEGEPHPAESHANQPDELATGPLASEHEPGETAAVGTNITEVNGPSAEGEEEVVESVGGS